MKPPVIIEKVFELPHPPSRLWPVLSRTDWINRSLGLPPIQYDVQPRDEGGSRVIARARVAGIALEWIELPFEWVENEDYVVRRVFPSGPLIELRTGLQFRPQEPAESTVRVFAEIRPRNRVGTWLAHSILGPKIKRDFGRIMAHVDEFFAGQKSAMLPQLRTTRTDMKSLVMALEHLRNSWRDADAVARIETFLAEAPDVELVHIRPFAMARRWGMDPWEVLRLFLHATRSGVLEFSWEVLCPNCRSMRTAPAGSLDKVAGEMHCSVCQIRYDAEFDKSVELKFQVAPIVRPVEPDTYCLAGPGGRPHVISQITVEAGETRLWRLPAPRGALRVRSPQSRDMLEVQALEPSGAGRVGRLLCVGGRMESSSQDGESRGRVIEVENRNPFTMELILEIKEWDEDILTAARVTNWQEFRDLFAREVISPAEKITVGSQVILFTDLRGSTAMYQDIGDAPAYALVRRHFDVLKAVVRDHHGAVVKTIGDAVMAGFSRVDEALAGVHAMHRRLAEENVCAGQAVSLALKSSLHFGPCLAVNANENLDYFGSTVNLAARMVSCCEGNDLTVSDAVYRRRETQEFLGRTGTRAIPKEVKFRGFSEPNKVWRIGMTGEETIAGRG